VNVKDKDGQMLLRDAVHRIDPRYAKAVLEAGAQVNAKSANGWTALMAAATYGSAEVVQLLIDAGADVKARDNENGYTILMWAAGSNREPKKKVQALLKAGADLKVVSNGGRSALMSAASSEALPVVELLLDLGEDISHRAKDGTTVLMVAARS